MGSWNRFGSCSSIVVGDITDLAFGRAFARLLSIDSGPFGCGSGLRGSGSDVLGSGRVDSGRVSGLLAGR